MFDCKDLQERVDGSKDAYEVCTKYLGFHHWAYLCMNGPLRTHRKESKTAYHGLAVSDECKSLARD